MYGMRLKELRSERGLSQEELAKKIGTSQRNISKYENEQLDLNTEIIKSICYYFQVSADYLLGRADDLGVVTIQSNAPALSAEEREVLDLFRKMTKGQKNRFIGFGEGLVGAFDVKKLS